MKTQQPFESAVIKQALDKLFNKSRYFDICSLDDIGRMLGVNPNKHPNYKYLRALHCINYGDLDPVIKQELPQRVFECLRPDINVNVDVFAHALTSEGNNFAPTEDEQFIRRIK